MKQKNCRKCGESKPVSDYYSQPSNLDGLNGQCKSCVKSRIHNWQKKNRSKKNEYNRRWKEKYPEHAKLVQFRSSLKCNYKLSTDEYLSMVTSQHELCALCNKKRKLLIDHCHKTGKVRGLLCYACNTALGMFKDDVGLLFKAVEYLK